MTGILTNAGLIGSAGVFAAAISTFMVYLVQNNVRSRYDDERHQVQLDMMRKSFEEQIYRLTERMVSTKSRWDDANHLVVAGERLGVPIEGKGEGVPRLQFLLRAGLRDEDFQVDPKLVFVLMPFHDLFKKEYLEISQTCVDLGLRCVRGDEEHIDGEILGHILQQLVKARFVIAVVDGRNPNVFYELGIAHSIGKSVLILSKEPMNVPFDIRTSQVVFYSSLENLGMQIKNALTRLVLAKA